MIETVQAKPDQKGVFVKFSTVDDVEFAIKRIPETSNLRIYRCSEHQMQIDVEVGSSHSLFHYHQFHSYVVVV